MLTNFTEIELNQMILNQVEENLHLDYKGAGSLAVTDSKKREIAKDVSAFANSDGGFVIYGIREFDDDSRRHLPERLDPIDRTFISKEWLEQVINSNIQPKIESLAIHPISLSSGHNHVAYVVKIPKSNTAHQASDKKYYKRYNSESVAMEDYEIKDIINRQTNPVLQLLLSPNSTTFIDNVIAMPIIIMNSSIKMAKDVKLTFQINEPQNCEVVKLNNLNDLSNLNSGKKLFGSMYDAKIYKGLNIQVGTISIRLLNNILSLSFTTNIYADNMEPMTDKFQIQIENGQVQYNLQS